jgi:hypothetical protein
MPGHYSAIDRARKGCPVSVNRLTLGSEYSLVKRLPMCHSADILGLKFLPVRSEGLFEALPFLGDLA